MAYPSSVANRINRINWYHSTPCQSTLYIHTRWSAARGKLRSATKRGGWLHVFMVRWVGRRGDENILDFHCSNLDCRVILHDLTATPTYIITHPHGFSQYQLHTPPTSAKMALRAPGTSSLGGLFNALARRTFLPTCGARSFSTTERQAMPLPAEQKVSASSPSKVAGRKRARYQFRPPRFYRGPLNPIQPPRPSAPNSREFIPEPFGGQRKMPLPKLPGGRK